MMVKNVLTEPYENVLCHIDLIEDLIYDAF